MSPRGWSRQDGVGSGVDVGEQHDIERRIQKR